MAVRQLPWQVGDIIEVTIENINHEGSGIGRQQGAVIFVPFTASGERVKVRVTALKKNFALGEVETILEPAASRTEPICQHFGLCGGCQYQHLDYEEQLRVKGQRVQEALTRIGGLPDLLVPVAQGGSKQYYYRNKVHWQVSTEEDRVSLGFYVRDSEEFFRVERCHLISDAMMEVKEVVEELINKHAIEAFDWEKGSGILRHVILREARFSGDMMIVFATNNTSTLPLDFIDELRSRLPFIRSAWISEHRRQGRKVMGERTIHLYGDKYLIDSIGSLNFSLSPQSFYQVNPSMTERLYRYALAMTGLQETDEVLDVYCGIGTITLFLAHRAKRAYGIESVEAAIEDARMNSELNAIDNAEFEAGSAGEVLTRLASEGVRPEVIVVDPPRKGCEPEALDAMMKMGPKRIVYVSCDPASLARDIKVLQGAGYQVGQVQPVDMFPQTGHVECIIMMTHSGQKGK